MPQGLRVHDGLCIDIMHFAENSLMPSGLEVHDYGEIKRPKNGTGCVL